MMMMMKAMMTVVTWRPRRVQVTVPSQPSPRTKLHPSPSYTRDSYAHNDSTIKTPTVPDRERDFCRVNRISPPHGGQYPWVTLALCASHRSCRHIPRPSSLPAYFPT